ncbi:F0F1 ATP synthase subunit B [Candidatus Pelagibacter sp.]|nr:F0F1 ATP synthase subunit B [Candidatus Pelagibacter sp.]
MEHQPHPKHKLESRKSQILENIEAAEKQREDSEVKLKEYDKIILKSKSEAKTMFNQTREKALKDIIAKKEVLDQQIDDEINKAEKEIEVLRVSAPDKINKIAIETSSELLEKLIGSGVNSSSISAIVDDLSKRNGDKYYGN